jgi:type IV pilus assembly protein PilN
MIRVNLLAVASGPAPTREWLPKEQRPAILGLGMLGASALLVGSYWFFLSSQKSSVETQIAENEARLVQLKEAAELVSQTNARKLELTERLSLIDRLRAAKRGPVTLLETVSAALPDGTWLIEVKQAGSSINVDGRAMSLTAVTDFAERLQNSGMFQRPVEIISTTSEVVEETGVVRFKVRAEAIAPSLPTATVSASAPQTPGA